MFIPLIYSSTRPGAPLPARIATRLSVIGSTFCGNVLGNAAGGLSRPMKQAWNEARGEPRCLWTLGHVPVGWAPDPSSDQMRVAHHLQGGEYDPNGPRVRGGTDGGAAKPPTGPRAGFGVARSNGVRIGRALPGKRQTAQRAEVAALAVAIECTTGPLTLAVVLYTCAIQRQIYRWERTLTREDDMLTTGVI